MELSATELKVLSEIANGNKRKTEIAKALKKSKSQICRIIKKLKNYGFIETSRSEILPKKEIHASLLFKILNNNKNIIEVLSDSGIIILESLLNSKNINEVIIKTGLKKAIIYRKLKKALNLSILKKEKKNYIFNDEVWPELKKFLLSFSEYYYSLDSRIPADSTIYFKNKKEILFSNPEEQKATKTAFSAYKDFGIKILTNEDFYYLPEKKLSKKEIFVHSLIIAEKKKEYRYCLYVALFYIKFKKEFKQLKNETLDNIKLVIKGENIKGYPSLKEIKEKAKQYDVQI